MAKRLIENKDSVKRTGFSSALKGGLSAFITTFLVIAAVLIFFPILAFQAKPSVVLTQSMQPTINAGDVAMIKRANPNEIKLGDVIEVYKRPNDPETFTHRVKSVILPSANNKEKMFATRGDANNVDDPPIKGAQIKGLVVNFPATEHPYVLPKLGYLKQYPVLLYTLLGITFAYLAWTFVKDARRKEASSEHVESLKAEEGNL